MAANIPLPTKKHKVPPTIDITIRISSRKLNAIWHHLEMIKFFLSNAEYH